jgi:hypothetical protein
VSSVAEHEHIIGLGRAYRQWALDRDQAQSAGFPIARFLLIHTLMRQVALECGYSSASLRERIYLGTPPSPATGLLLSTAASDIEGTLGGLVALERRYLEGIPRQALEDPAHCSSDRCAASTSWSSRQRSCTTRQATRACSPRRLAAVDRAVLVDLTAGDGFVFPLR